MNLLIDDLYPTMPWDLLDAVVFDIGNVLVSFRPEKVLAELFPGEPEKQTVLLNKIMRTPYWIALDHGTMTYEEAADAMTGRDKALRPDIERVLASWIDLKDPVDEGIEALRAAKAHGKKAYVLSNYHDSAFAFIQKKYGFFGLMDGEIVSSHVKLLKPDPAIYRLLTDTFALEPSRTLFIDDTPANIEAALCLGWQGFCLNVPGKLRRFLQEG